MTAVTLLDGGMGQELVRRSGDRPTPLWSTQVMLDHPGLVAQVHGDFFAAGAGIATTNTYALHRDRLVGGPLATQFETLCAAALSEAAAARATAGRGRIAGSIGPLGGSYRPDNHPPQAQAVPLYAEVARLLAPSVDLMLCETIVSLDHTRAILKAAQSVGLPVWLAFSVQDGDGTRLRSGERLVDVLPLIDGATAVMCNCTAPEAVPAALDILARSGLPYGAYANGFTRISVEFLAYRPTVDALSARQDLPPAIYADHVLRWADNGATIIGGCCEIGPDHIAAIADRLRAGGYNLT